MDCSVQTCVVQGPTVCWIFSIYIPCLLNFLSSSIFPSVLWAVYLDRLPVHQLSFNLFFLSYPLIPFFLLRVTLGSPSDYFSITFLGCSFHVSFFCWLSFTMNHFPVHFVIWDYKRDFIFLWDSWQPELSRVPPVCSVCFFWTPQSQQSPRAILLHYPSAQGFPTPQTQRGANSEHTGPRCWVFMGELFIDLVSWFPSESHGWDNFHLVSLDRRAEFISPSFHWVSSPSVVEFLANQIR